MRALRSLLAGVVLLTLPGGLGGLAVIAQSDDALPLPTEFYGTGGAGECYEWGCEFLISEISDPRLDGTAAFSTNVTEYGNIAVFNHIYRFQTEDGAWQGEPVPFFWGSGLPSASLHVLTGVGAYEGLTAILEAAELEAGGVGLRGVIFEGQVPPAPAPPPIE